MLPMAYVPFLLLSLHSAFAATLDPTFIYAPAEVSRWPFLCISSALLYVNVHMSATYEIFTNITMIASSR